MIAIKRRLVTILTSAGLIAAASACNLFTMIDAPASPTPDAQVPFGTIAAYTLAPATSTDETSLAQTIERTVEIPPGTSTPGPTTISGRRDEDFGTYLLTTYTETTRYPITGETAEELDAAMDLNGPRDDASGTAWFALTVPLFDWDWGCVCDEESGCRSVAVAISLSLTYALPAWHYDTPPADLLAQWTAFDKALTDHEHGHGDLAHTCAMSLGERVAAVTGVDTCETVDQLALAEINAALADCRAEQRAYEDATNHGTNDGVVWPP